MTICKILSERAKKQPVKTAYMEIASDGSVKKEINNEQLWQNSLKFAGAISQKVGRGDPLLLSLPSGLNFVESFFGCLLSGAVAVPTHLAHAAFLRRSLERIDKIIATSRAAVGVTTEENLKAFHELSNKFKSLNLVEWITLESLRSSMDDLNVELSSPGGDDIVAIQYTSGTQSDPKGVALTHKNILENARLICQVTDLNDETRLLSWLPHSHDMGLVGGIMVPFVAGGVGLQMKTIDFIKNPILWMHALARHNCTCTPAPNFAFDLVIREAKRKDIPPGDLSAMRVMFNGAEPVRANTVKEFYETFRHWGLREDVVYPCYGLAEATLMVAGAKKARSLRTVRVKKESLQGRIEILNSEEDPYLAYVSCGVAIPEHSVIIVDSNTDRILDEGYVGEILVQGKSITSGYWAPEGLERGSKFSERIVDGETVTYFRTGDLGFFYESELYIVGRLDDVIFLNGEKIHPTDIEAVVSNIQPEIPSNSSALFSVEENGRNKLVLAVELKWLKSKLSDERAFANQIRAETLEKFGLDVHVLLLKSGGLKKTTSGKVQRTACREAYLTGQLN